MITIENISSIITNGLTTVVLKYTPDIPSNWWDHLLPSLIEAAIPAVAVLIAAVLAIRQVFVDKRFEYAAKILDLRLQQINDFYAPMHILVEQSRLLYEKLLFIKKQGNPNFNPTTFRLLDNIHADKDDKAFGPTIQSIIKVGGEMERIIKKHGNLIDDGHKAVFIQYLAHLDILTDASKAQSTPTASYPGWQKFGYYPRILNREIAEHLKFLERQVAKYVQTGDDFIGKLLNLKRGATESDRKHVEAVLDTIRYYEINADILNKKYELVDMTPFLKMFANQIVPNQPVPLNSKAILDVGCGTGRDSIWFLMQGFKVTTIDASPAMLRLTRSKAFDLNKTEQLSYREVTYDEIDYVDCFDGVWASAAFVHLTDKEIHDSLTRLFIALKPCGTLYASFKFGRGCESYSGRTFRLQNKLSLDNILKGINIVKLNSVEYIYSIIDDKTGQAKTISFWSAIINRRKAWISIICKK